MIFHSVEYKNYVKLRVIATLIDYGIYFLLLIIYIYCLGTKNDDDSMQVNGLLALPIFVFWFLYFVVLETVNQATPGHDICKLVVVRSNGEKITLGVAFKRRIIDMIDVLCYGIPALICIYNTPKYQRLGDLFADTVVVKKTDIIKKEVVF
jgi:uncharacterized RDD family membrane protein YckC